jgi:hypothetical protein
LLLSTSVLVLSGCATFLSPPVATQNQVIGSVRISFTVCASQPGGSTSGSCANMGNASSSPFSSGFASSGPSQLFLGFRVPRGASAPGSFGSTTTGPDGSAPQLQFARSTSYTNELQRLDPAPAGVEWVGYTSQYVDYDNASGDQNFSADVDFGLPERADGSPFAGPFTYQAVVGGRQQGTDPTEPIDCGSSLTTSWGGPGSATQGICVDDPAAADLDSDSSLETRDAGITPGAAASVVQGGTVTVPFTFAAATNVPGAAASPSITTLAPTANSSKVVDVSVAVPEHAAPGTYSVTLTARLSDGESRTATTALVVGAAPVSEPAVQVTHPVNTSSPSIAGKRRQGQILSALRGAWASHSASFSYRWQRCKSSARACSAISRSDKRRYRLKAADIGAQLRVLVTATNAGGSTRAASARTSAIKARLGSRPEIREAMSIVLVPRGEAAAIPALLEHGGYVFSFHAPAAGRLLIAWYLKEARSDERVLVARGSAAISSAETAKVKLSLTTRGKELLAQAERLELVGSGRFAQTGKQRVVTVEKKLTLER